MCGHKAGGRLPQHQGPDIGRQALPTRVEPAPCQRQLGQGTHAQHQHRCGPSHLQRAQLHLGGATEHHLRPSRVHQRRDEAQDAQQRQHPAGFLHAVVGGPAERQRGGGQAVGEGVQHLEPGAARIGRSGRSGLGGLQVAACFGCQSHVSKWLRLKSQPHPERPGQIAQAGRHQEHGQLKAFATHRKKHSPQHRRRCRQHRWHHAHQAHGPAAAHPQSQALRQQPAQLRQGQGGGPSPHLRCLPQT